MSLDDDLRHRWRKTDGKTVFQAPGQKRMKAPMELYSRYV